MNTQLVGELIRLRYKLMWAKTRSRNGKIALFFAGYLLLLLLIAVLTAGGFGAATLAVRSGRAEFVTRIALTSLFAQALLTTVMMGFGMNAIFSDLELRRYPVTAGERHLVRHLIGMIDPFWLLTFALELGLAVGLYVLGAAGLGTGLLAILLLLPANYLAARIIGELIDRMMQRPAGSAVLMGLVICLSFSGAAIPPLLKKFPGIAPAAARALSGTPPFGAARAMTGDGAQAAAGFMLEIAWVFGLGAMLVGLERRKPRRRVVEATELSFDSFHDRLPAVLGFRHAPLIGWWLRFYGRNGRFKAMVGLTLPMVAFLTFNFASQKNGPGWFAAAMGAFPVATFFATSRFMVNQFGYLAGGYRRCFLLPVEPGIILRTGSYASLLVSAAFIPAGAVAWSFLAPVPFDIRQVGMLVMSAFAGLFLFHGLGLWTTLYGPRKGDYNQSFGNDLSLLANIVVIAGVLACIFGPSVVAKLAPGVFDAANWWWWIAAPAVTGGFYAFSLRATSSLLCDKRERLMAVVEGRN